MKICRFFLPLLLAWMIAAPQPLGAEEPPLVMARVTDWKPIYWPEGPRWLGMDIDFFRALERDSGLTFSFVKLPWARGLYSLQDGTCTIMSQLSKTAERQKFMHFLGPYKHEEMVLVVHRDDADLAIDNLDDLVAIAGQQKLKIGIERDVWYGKAFKARMEGDPDFARHFHYQRGDAAELVVRKRLLGMLEQKVVIAYKIRTLPSYKVLAIHRFTANSDAVYFGVSKKASSVVVEKLNQTVERLRADGTFASIEAQWKTP